MSVMHTEVAIADTESESGVIDLSGQVLVTIHAPAEWDAAELTLLAGQSLDGDFYPVHDPTGEYSIAFDADQIVVVPPDITRGLRFVKLRSGDTAAAVAQSPARTLIVGTLPDDRA